MDFPKSFYALPSLPLELFRLNFQKGNEQNTLKLRVKVFSLLKHKTSTWNSSSQAFFFYFLMVPHIGHEDGRYERYQRA